MHHTHTQTDTTINIRTQVSYLVPQGMPSDPAILTTHWPDPHHHF